MDCPQCGDTLETYTLREGDGEASVCATCGYVGIPAEHRVEPARDETWNDALRRYYRSTGSDDDPRVEVGPPLARPSSASEPEESWDDALRRFRARRGNGTGGSDGDGGTGGSDGDGGTGTGGDGTRADDGDASTGGDADEDADGGAQSSTEDP